MLSKEESMRRLLKIDSRLIEIQKEIDILSSVYTQRSELLSKAIESDVSQRIQEEHEQFMHEYLKRVGSLRKSVESLTRKKNIFLQDNKIKKAYTKHSRSVFIQKQIDLHRKGGIDQNMLSILQEGFNKGNGKIRYSDTLCFRPDGRFLVVQRSSKDSGNPLHLNIEMEDSEIGKRLLESIGTITLKYPELEKARHGVYQDNPENRRLKRVGQKYGTKRQEEPTKQKQQGKKEESKMSTKEFTDEDLEDFARQASEEELNIASTGKDERLRLAAKIELARRKDEEEIVVVREDELNKDGSIKGDIEDDDKEEDSKKDIKPKDDERKGKGNNDKE